MFLTLGIACIVLGLIGFMSSPDPTSFADLQDWLSAIEMFLGYVLLGVYDYRATKKLDKLIADSERKKDK